MAATMTELRRQGGDREQTQLRVTRHGYDPADVHSLLASARARLVELADRLRRAEEANVTLVAEARHWKARAKAAESHRRRLEDALAAAEATVATSVAEVQARADQMVERARCEAEHLTMQAQERARRLREEAEVDAEARAGAGWPASGELDFAAGDDADEVFKRFMSDEIADEPSREWVIGST